MSPMGAILRYGAHVPRLRLARSVITEAMAWANPPGRSRSQGARAIGNWDEDALTMGVQAARSCLAPPDGGVAEDLVPQSLLFCSTTAPFADRDDAVVLSTALDLNEDIEILNFGSSLRAGSSGLIAAARRGDSRTLVVAADARLTRAGSAQELTYGDAAAAVLVGPPGPRALATILAARSIGSDFVDHYRMSGAAFDYALEERWVRDESLTKRVPQMIAQLLSAAGCGTDAVSHFAVPVSAATAKRIAETCGLATARRDATVLGECGDAGVLDGSHSLARGLARKREEPSYVRYLSHRGLLDVDFGMRAERDQRTAHSVAYRKRDAITAFKGGRCERCGAVQFPLSRVCVNPACRATDTQTLYRLADTRGRVKTFTEDWQAY